MFVAYGKEYGEIVSIKMTDKELEMLEKVEMAYNLTSRVPYYKAKFLANLLNNMPIGKPMTVSEIQRLPGLVIKFKCNDGNVEELEYSVQKISGNMRKLIYFGYIERTEVKGEPITIKVRGKNKTIIPTTTYFTRLK